MHGLAILSCHDAVRTVRARRRLSRRHRNRLRPRSHFFHSRCTRRKPAFRPRGNREGKRRQTQQHPPTDIATHSRECDIVPVQSPHALAVFRVRRHFTEIPHVEVSAWHRDTKPSVLIGKIGHDDPILVLTARGARVAAPRFDLSASRSDDIENTRAVSLQERLCHQMAGPTVRHRNGDVERGYHLDLRAAAGAAFHLSGLVGCQLSRHTGPRRRSRASLLDNFLLLFAQSFSFHWLLSLARSCW